MVSIDPCFFVSSTAKICKVVQVSAKSLYVTEHTPTVTLLRNILRAISCKLCSLTQLMPVAVRSWSLTQSFHFLLTSISSIYINKFTCKYLQDNKSDTCTCVDSWETSDLNSWVIYLQIFKVSLLMQLTSNLHLWSTL